MSDAAWSALLLAACAAVILATGVRLSRYGDIIAKKTGIGGTLMGLIAMAAVTSLPELITGASSMLIFDVPDIAVGDAVGSCMFNLVILALLDVRNPVPLSARIHQGHVLSAAFGIIQLGLVALAMVLGPAAPLLGWIGVHSLVFIGVYVLSMGTLLRFERSRVSQIAEELTGEIHYAGITLRRAGALYALNATVLVAAAAWLPGIGERFAAQTGLGEGFVGNLLIAASTSMPEVIVSAAAARIGALDMAAANLLGSNLFNVAVIGVDDVLYARGSVLAASTPGHMVSVAAAIIMTGVAVVGVTFRAQRKRFALSWDGLAILVTYGVAVVALYQIT